MSTKTYTRIAHRVPSMWGSGDTWRVEGIAYICNSGLADHFNVPKQANELQVDIIVSKRRPDAEAQRVWALVGDTLEIEGPGGSTLGDCRFHSVHPRFRRQLQLAKRYAKDHDSKMWMLVHYDMVDASVADEGGTPRKYL